MPTISPDKPYRIGRSRTGLGLFATRPIKKGAKIIRYMGRMLDCQKKKDDAVENKYLFQISKRWTIDGSMRENVARYINHACKPNAESDVSKAKRRVVIRAIKAIAPGEEINYDYGEEYFKEYLKPIGCKCDACEKKRKRKAAKLRAERVALKAKELAKAKRKARTAAKTATKSKAKSPTVAANEVRPASRKKPVVPRAADAKPTLSVVASPDATPTPQTSSLNAA